MATKLLQYYAEAEKRWLEIIGGIGSIDRHFQFPSNIIFYYI
jgi:hypothetical protein